MYKERFAELLGYLQTYLKNGRPDLVNSPEFDPEKWLAKWCETKNPRLGSGHDRPSDLWDGQDGFDEVDSRLREAVRSIEVQSPLPVLNKPAHPLIDGVYLECREGWYNIIQVLCEALEDQSKRFGAPVPRVQQVKEKFGTLHFYVDQSSDAQDALICMAEELSARTCEICGRPGQRRATGWTETTCDEHAAHLEPPL